jgi:hypothetical protein
MKYNKPHFETAYLGVNVKKMLKQKSSQSAQFHKTLLSVIYANSSMTIVKTQGNMPIAA